MRGKISFPSRVAQLVCGTSRRSDLTARYISRGELPDPPNNHHRQLLGVCSSTFFTWTRNPPVTVFLPNSHFSSTKGCALQTFSGVFQGHAQICVVFQLFWKQHLHCMLTSSYKTSTFAFDLNFFENFSSSWSLVVRLVTLKPAEIQISAVPKSLFETCKSLKLECHFKQFDISVSLIHER